MALPLVFTGDTFNASLLNGLIAVLQQPAGGQEKGHYKIQGNMYTIATSLYLSCCSITLSRTTTPVSCSIDTADAMSSNLNAPAVSHLTMGCMQIYAKANATSAHGYAGGNYTMQY